MLVYSGQYDMVCHHLGTEKSLEQLQWSGQKDFNQAKRGVWVVDRRPAVTNHLLLYLTTSFSQGYVKSSRNLQSLLVLDAGHMVPMDQPRTSLNMISRFIEGKPLRDGDSSIAASLNQAQQDCVPRRKTFDSSSSSSNDMRNNSNSNRKGIRRKQVDKGGGGGTRGRHLLVEVEEEVEEEKEVVSRRELVEEGDVSVLVTNLISLDRSIALRLKVHNSHPHNRPKHHRIDLVVDPGGKEVMLDFRGNSLDVLVDHLNNGEDYSFSVKRTDKEGVTHVVSKRSATARPGCHSPSISQCCGRGECIRTGVDQQQAECRCDAGFSGDFCDHYLVSLAGGATTNISGAGLLCPAKLFAANLTFFYDTGRTSLESKSNFESHLKRRGEDNWCRGNNSSFDYCEVSIEFPLQPKYPSLWQQPDRFSLYRQTISSGFAVDLLLTLESILSDKSLAVRTLKSVTVQRQPTIPRSEGDVVSLNRSASPHHTSSFFGTLTIAGNASVVEQVVSNLVKQSGDSNSFLRKGIVSIYIKSTHLLVVTHLSAVPMKDSHRVHWRRRISLLYNGFFSKKETLMSDVDEANMGFIPSIYTTVVFVFGILSVIAVVWRNSLGMHLRDVHHIKE